MDTLPVRGTVTTNSFDSSVTDSAAATALACGRKTRRGVLGMTADGRALKNIVEEARDAGMKVGILSSVSLDHATPAGFYAHQPSRDDYYEIDVQLAKSNVDYFGGGSVRGVRSKYLKNRETGEKRPSPIDLARQNGFTIVTTREALQTLKPGGKVWACNHKTDRNGALYYEIDRPADHVSLAEFTRKGIELLENPRGFFMMVEGGRIDWACHANDAATAARDVIAFDEAVAEALAFYREHPKETLMVVTADHETGGMSIENTVGRETSAGVSLRNQKMSHVTFSQKIAEFRKRGLTFAQALPEICRVFGFQDLTRNEAEQLKDAYCMSVPKSVGALRGSKAFRLYGTKDPLTTACTRIVAQRDGISWKTFSHTGVPVPVTVIGVGQERFAGRIDSTDIYKSIVQAMLPARQQSVTTAK